MTSNILTGTEKCCKPIFSYLIFQDTHMKFVLDGIKAITIKKLWTRYIILEYQEQLTWDCQKTAFTEVISGKICQKDNMINLFMNLNQTDNSSCW